MKMVLLLYTLTIIVYALLPCTHREKEEEALEWIIQCGKIHSKADNEKRVQPNENMDAV